jgi:ATP-dependent RNA helicase SUPV3L1/SUV3
MQPTGLRNVCIQCRWSLQQRASFHLSARVLRSQQTKQPPRLLHADSQLRPEKTSRLKRAVAFNQPSPLRLKTVRDIRTVLLEKLVPWSVSTSTIQRLEAFGIHKKQHALVMIQFRKIVISELQRQDVDDDLNPSRAPRGPRWNYHMIYEELQADKQRGVDRAFMRRFFLFCEERPDLGLGHLSLVQDALGMQNPAEWHGPARSARRRIIFHVGPTNSGKTYRALQALAASRVGVYAGPLRLLAFEIYDRLNKGLIPPTGADPQGIYPRPCNLVTGEEQRIAPDATLSSSTIEMLALNVKYDVAVIDEIQMIADEQRGSAWTNALLGLTADEIHVCGEESAVPLVQQLLADTGDEISVNRYQRLSPLQVATQSMESNWADIRRGDCIVAFSRRDIFAFKQFIEQKTGLRCAVAYGKLPPEIRAEQALLFNKPDGDYPVIVASDAIGMGLNL